MDENPKMRGDMPRIIVSIILFTCGFTLSAQESTATVTTATVTSVLLYETAQKLTGVSEQEVVRINEGLRKDVLKYRSELGTEEDSLFVIVTKTYFRVAYPLIFSKEAKK